MSTLRLRLRVPGFLALAALGICQAQSNPPKAGRSAATYLQSLSDDQRKDYEALRADWDKMRSDQKWQDRIVLMAQTILGRFGYGTKFTAVLDPQTQEALQTYQANRGIPVSGRVDPLTFFALTNDDKIADRRFLHFGPYSFFWGDIFLRSWGVGPPKRLRVGSPFNQAGMRRG